LRAIEKRLHEQYEINEWKFQLDETSGFGESRQRDGFRRLGELPDD
jgi:hypothetical protein